MLLITYCHSALYHTTDSARLELLHYFVRATKEKASIMILYPFSFRPGLFYDKIPGFRQAIPWIPWWNMRRCCNQSARLSQIPVCPYQPVIGMPFSAWALLYSFCSCCLSFHGRWNWPCLCRCPPLRIKSRVVIWPHGFLVYPAI